MATRLDRLLALLYGAHDALTSAYFEVQDWSRVEARHVLMVETDATGTRRLHWASGGPNATQSETVRRVWWEPPSRIRVDVLHRGVVMRTVVRDGMTWWRWDRENGTTAGDTAEGQALPPLLEPVLLHPARLLSSMRLQLTGSGTRAGRKVVVAEGAVRNSQEAETSVFEFDAEHGTPLYVATFRGGERWAMSEVTVVDYEATVNPAVFRFGADSVPASPQAVAPERLDRTTQRPSARPRAQLPLPVASNTKTVWLTGLSGAGKTSIARATERLLLQLGIRCCLLDGDVMRQGISSDLTMARKDRAEQARRAAYIAVLLADASVLSIVALVSPYSRDRARARSIHAASGVGFLEVWVDTPLEVCEARDTKGLYAAARSSASASTAPSVQPDGSGLTAMTSPYEAPEGPDLRVCGHGQPPIVAAKQIVSSIFAGESQASALSVFG